MRKLTKVRLVVALVLVVAVISGCGDSTETTTGEEEEPAPHLPDYLTYDVADMKQAPEFFASIGEEELENLVSIPCQMGTREWNQVAIDCLEPCEYIMGVIRGVNVLPPTTSGGVTAQRKIFDVPLGTQVTLSLRGPAPESINVKEIGLTEEGKHIYASGEKSVAIAPKNADVYTGEYVFTLKENMDGVLRGFHITCTWDNGNDCSYGFVVNTKPESAGQGHIELVNKDNLYLANLTFLTEFGTANEGGVTFDFDKDLLKFSLRKETGMQNDVADGPQVNFQMKMSTGEILSHEFIPAPVFEEASQKKYSGEVLEISEERMTEIGKMMIKKYNSLNNL